ncbi:hypothetical protein SAMN05443661_12152 [Natronobacterium gregoryi]|uniref:Uncharacterized protein n=3 Tax=Natronobacterium gregoryi TaxID=44930 RepID=L0AL79_NATGS|nr:hypothetical protein Natgr_3515 [Natronobacterium gregoryi SP2]SFJ30918.1 hypothetical protein SAMN05443661_12152 [Natronobacterium gregoryi]
MTFDLSNTIDQIKQKSAGLDTDTYPDCDTELEMWAAGNMNEQLECPGCGERYVIDSVTFLERVGEC